MSNGVNRKEQEHHTRGASILSPGGNTDRSGHDTGGDASEWLNRGARQGTDAGRASPNTPAVAASLGTETREERGERLREEARTRNAARGERTGRTASRRRTTQSGSAADTSRREASEASRGSETGTEEGAKPAEQVIPRVARPKIVPLFKKREGKETLSDEFVAELWKGLFLLPSMWGWDDPDSPWWPLRQDEADNLSAPSARMLARMSPEQQELVSRFADPLLLAMGLAGAMSWRMEMTRAYRKQLRIVRETEARRAALSRSTQEDTRPVRRRVDGESEQRENVPTGEIRDGFSDGTVKDAFD